MTYFPEIHHRRSIRLKDFDYSQSAAYFVTLVIRQRKCLLGEIFSESMHLYPVGQVIKEEWHRLEERFPGLFLDEYLIMPNHVHGILIFSEKQRGEGVHFLGSVIGAYKSTTSRLINCLNHSPGAPLWQRNYYERIIRDLKELNRVRLYIADNPRKWLEDQEYIPPV